MIAALALLVLPAGADAALDPDSSSYDWGDVGRYQQSYQQTFKFTNNEGFGVNPQAGINGADAGAFVRAYDNCSAHFVPDGGSCDIAVYVQPQNVGPLSASLDVDDGSGVASVSLAAKAVTGTLDISPDPIDFYPQPWYYGSQSFNVNVQAQNYGVAISDVQISGPDQALFSLNYGNCIGNTLQAWNGCSVGVGFNPTGPSGPASANLVITSDGNGSPQTVPITANSLNGPEEQITPHNKDFGPVALGSASATETFTITNVGDSPDQIQQVFPVSGSPQSFPVSNDDCTLQVVAPGESCTFDISFSPVAAGAKEASIFVISSGPSPVTQVGLSGQGYGQPGVAAVIDGTPQVGKSLDCDPINANGELSYRWLRNGTVIGGAQKPSYELDDSDFGALISCRVTATNPVGSVNADSPPTAPVAARSLANESHSLVDEASCRMVAVDPIGGVDISGTSPATPDAPLTFKAHKRLSVELGRVRGQGKRVRFTPRRLAALNDGAVDLTVDGRAAQAVLAPCKLSGRVSGFRGGSTTYALSGATGVQSGSLRTPSLKIKPRKRGTGMVSVFVYGQPTVRFPINGKKAEYNGIKVSLARHAVKVRGLFAETSAVEVELARHVVRGRGGNAKAKAKLRGQGKAKASFKTAWR